MKIIFKSSELHKMSMSQILLSNVAGGGVSCYLVATLQFGLEKLGHLVLKLLIRKSH